MKKNVIILIRYTCSNFISAENKSEARLLLKYSFFAVTTELTVFQSNDDSSCSINGSAPLYYLCR